MQLIYASELEISTSSSESFEDAENILKALASRLGFNAIVNTVRSQHTKGMSTEGTEQTETDYSTRGYFAPTILSNGTWGVSRNQTIDKSSSTTKINTKTTVDNVFSIKGVLALIGKEDPKNGQEYDPEHIEELCLEFCELTKTMQRTYWSIDKLNQINDRYTKPLGGIVIGLIIVSLNLVFSNPLGGLVWFGIYYLISLGYYFSAKNKEKQVHQELAPLDSELKELVDEYGDDLFDIYQLAPYVKLKHIGE